MLNKIRQMVPIRVLAEPRRDRSRSHYQPEQPINFVRRSDPNFYFLAKR